MTGQTAPGQTRPDTPEKWAGRARMAAARQHANQPLDTIDIEALNRQETR